MENERAYWVSWSTISGVGPILLKRLQKHFGSLAVAWRATATELLEVEGFGLLTVDAVIAERQRIEPAALLQQYECQNPGFWTPADANYPRLLLEIPDSPAVLYHRGEVNFDELMGCVPMVAIVGTRSPSDYGRRWTRRITELLTRNGFTIVSGLAEGIDTEAHRSCLGQQGRTIAVLGCGADVVYPWSNRGMYQQIVQSGLILSEHPAGTKPDRMFFPRRNRIIAGLCRATLLMEAGEKSGGLITAHFANDYGRDVYVLPGSLDNPKAIGCLKLVNKGAHLIVDEQELLELLGTVPSLDRLPARTITAGVPPDLPPELAQVLQAITELSARAGSPPVSFDRIVEKTELPAAEISVALTNLELQDLIVSLPGMQYQRS
jgi:DNA processing protein